MNVEGFSLVELSIVLVILGLLTGGILSGQSLIRAAEMRSISTDFSRYVTAVHTFRSRYNALPGDMRNATRFWGAQAGGTADGPDSACSALLGGTPATGTATCNGDGNGQISNANGNSGTNATWYEVWRAWQHLANAGLIEGTYSGVSSSTTSFVIGAPGVNAPRSKASQAGYAIVWRVQITSDSWMFPGTYGNTIRFGGGESMDQEGLISAEEAWNIDTKIDDGKPGQGKMRTYLSTRRPHCSTTDDAATSEYRVTATAQRNCNLIFITGF